MRYTYFIDIDGVLLKHNGDLSAQITRPSDKIEQALKFINGIDKADGKIILTTGRKESTRAHTEQSLTSLGIFYDELIMGCARGPRILVNDNKPTFPNKTAFAFTLERNNMSIEDINKMLAPEEVRPWGSFSTLCYSKEYNIKEIIVNPGESSSLQSHNHRDEYWLVISGEGKAITNVSDTSLYVGKIIFIERGTKHRVCNTGKNILKFIEIQVGDSFDENDIIRYEDNYNRK